MRKSIWMNDPLNRLAEEIKDQAESKGKGTGLRAGRGGGFSQRLGDIVERYDVLMRLMPAPDLTSDEKMILGEVVCGSVVTPTMIKYMYESVLDCASGTATERQALSDKIEKLSYTERMALIEALGQ